MTKYELPDCWYYQEDGGGSGEWFLMSGTIIARIHMHIPGNCPILADCITYKATLWTNQTIIANSEYKSLEKAKSGCEEQIRKYLEFLDSTKERVEDDPETKIEELEAKCVGLEALDSPENDLQVMVDPFNKGAKMSDITTAQTRIVYLLTYETRNKCWGGLDWNYGEWHLVSKRHSEEPPMERLKAKICEETVRNLVLEKIQETVISCGFIIESIKL